MKAYLNYILLIAVILTGCKFNKSNSQYNDNESTFKIDCKHHSKQTSYFSGKVTDVKNDEPLVMATVEIQSINGAERYGCYTNSDGNFTIENVPLGKYRLRVTCLTFDQLDGEIEIKEYSNCIVAIKLFAKTMQVEKPVIYLYPTQKQSIHVKINYAGNLTHTYPKYSENGWHVTAEPNGTLRDENNQEYYALFWEGRPTQQINPSDGFVVPGKETAAFLEEKLAYLGLNRREANEFIMYWLPRMEDNSYNFIHFAGKQYEQQASLDINPKPETIIRVMMLTQPLKNSINAPLQDLSDLRKTRKGFTVIEWGGSVIDTIIDEI